MKCQCSWIDSAGKPTHDINDAIAMAVCYDAITFGEAGSPGFPICEKHAQMRKLNSRWKLLPLPNQKMEDAHYLVKLDDRAFKIIPNVVVDKIKQQFPKHRVSIIHDLVWDSLMGCWFFIRDGVYFGVEQDGTIHT